MLRTSTNRVVLWLALVAFALKGGGVASAQQTPRATDENWPRYQKQAESRVVAELFLRYLAARDAPHLADLLDPEMAKEFPLDHLDRLVLDVVRISDSTAEPVFERLQVTPANNVHVVFVVKGRDRNAEISVVVAPTSKIIGFSLEPIAKPDPKDWPAYAPRDLVDEEPVTIGSPPWALNAAFTLPKGKGPFPAAVLIADAGPMSGDAQFGPNRIFRDLAWGLAAKGVATIRFDKRTKAHGPSMSPPMVSLDTEYFDDVAAALTALRADDRVAHDRIFLIGHGLGGVIAPHAAALDAQVAGVVMLAPLGRPMLDQFVAEGRRMVAKGDVTPEQKKDFESIERTVQRVRTRAFPGAAEVLGLSAAYWYDLESFEGENAAAAIRELHRPVLVLLPQRDAARTGDDGQLWRKSLGDARNVTLEEYPRLTRLLIAGEGDFAVAEYEQQANVDAGLVRGVAGWIKQQKPQAANEGDTP